MSKSSMTHEQKVEKLLAISICMQSMIASLLAVDGPEELKDHAVETIEAGLKELDSLVD